MRESRSKRRAISCCERPPGGTKPSTTNFGWFGLPPVTSGAYWSPRKPTSLKRPFAPVRITNGGRSPEYVFDFIIATTAPIAGYTSPPPGLRPVCMRYVAVSWPKCGWVIVRMNEQRFAHLARFGHHSCTFMPGTTVSIALRPLL